MRELLRRRGQGSDEFREREGCMGFAISFGVICSEAQCIDAAKIRIILEAIPCE